MTAQRPSSVDIRQLRVRCEASLPLPAERVRREVERADWPRVPAERWVFVRKVHVRAALANVAAALAAEARAKIDAGVVEEVVEFDSFVDMLAALSVELATGEAGRRWYWQQRWAPLIEQPRSAALAAVFEEHVAHLAALCERLAARQALLLVWSQLDEPAASRLSSVLAQRGRFKLPAAQPNRALEPMVLVWSDAPLQRFRPVLESLPASDARHLLARVLIAQEVAPLLLQCEPSALLGSIAQLAAARPRPRPRPRQLAAMDRLVPSAEPARPTRASPKSVGSQSSAAEAVAHDRLREHAKSSRSGQLQVSPQLVAAGAVASVESVRVEQGGLLYLLNFLNRREVQGMMIEHWRELANGWAWLYRLGKTLELDDADPICNVIAQQLGLDEPSELAALPALPCAQEIERLAQRWYGKTGVWNRELLLVRAHVHADSTHVDLHTSLSAVRTPVRLAALDINPGWLPWLGRVVTFHFE